MDKIRVKYLGPSPARIIPGVGEVRRGAEFSFPAEYRGQSAEEMFGPPMFEVLAAEKPKAPAAPVGGDK